VVTKTTYGKGNCEYLKGVPNGGSGYSEATSTETCTDTRYRQQIRVRRMQTMRWNIM